MIIPLLFVAAGIATLTAIVLSGSDEPPVHNPDLPSDTPPPPGMPRSTHYKLVDAILGELKKASDSSKIPLGLLVGWIAKESGGKLGEVTSLGERGYFQLMPAESKSLGLDHERLSTDSVYSINGGLLLIGKYMKEVLALGVASPSSSYFWRLVKLAHTMGTGAMKKIVADAQAAGQAGSWDALETYALANNDQLLHETKHAPAKWFPFMDALFEIGKPFGFGSDTTTIVGDDVNSDIPDVLNLFPPLR